MQKCVITKFQTFEQNTGISLGGGRHSFDERFAVVGVGVAATTASAEMALAGVGDTAHIVDREERAAGHCARVVEVTIANTHDGAHARGGVGVQAVLLLRRAELRQIGGRGRRASVHFARVNTRLLRHIECQTGRARLFRRQLVHALVVERARAGRVVESLQLLAVLTADARRFDRLDTGQRAARLARECLQHTLVLFGTEHVARRTVHVDGSTLHTQCPLLAHGLVGGRVCVRVEAISSIRTHWRLRANGTVLNLNGGGNRRRQCSVHGRHGGRRGDGGGRRSYRRVH